MQTVRYGFLEAVQPFLCTEIEGDSRSFSEKFGTHPKAAIQSFIGTEIEAPAVINFWVKFRTVHTVFGMNFEGRTTQFSRRLGTVFEELFLLHIPYSLSRNLARKPRQSVQHLLLGQPYSCTDFWHRNRGAFSRTVQKDFLRKKV
jgi:hypothetical protein